MPVSVLVPSKLEQNPDGSFLCERAIQSVQAQTCKVKEIILALDQGVEMPPGLAEKYPKLRSTNWEGKGHVGALNKAVKEANSSMLAFLEDDDEWTPTYLDIVFSQSPFDFISATQELILPSGESGGFFHFPTASSWLISRLQWFQLEGGDTRYRIHWDNQFLGKLNEAGIPRLHLVPEGTPKIHPWLQTLSRFTEIREVPGLKSPPVKRYQRENSILGQQATDKTRQERSKKEYAALEVLYGTIPW